MALRTIDRTGSRAARWLSAAVGFLFLCGCPTRPSESSPTTPGYPRTIETGLESDAAAQLTLTRPVERIGPANASGVDFLFALGLEARIVAIPETTFQYANVELNPKEWEGRTFAQYVGESLLATQPDLVLVHSWQNLETTRLLEGVGIPVLALPEPHAVDDVLSSIDALGRVLACEDKSREVLEDLRARIDALELESDRFANVRILSYTNLGTGAWTAGSGTTTDLMLELAGLQNAAAEHGLEGHANIDFELLLSLDPDVILVSSSKSDPLGTSAKYLRGEEVLSGLRALREDHIVTMPSRLLATNSHFIVDAAEELARRVAELLER